MFEMLYYKTFPDYSLDLRLYINGNKTYNMRIPVVIQSEINVEN